VNLSALTQIQAAALLSVAPRTLRDWHDAPRTEDGRYPGPALVAYYVGKLQGQGGEFDDQRQRLAAAQAEKVEHDNAVRRGRLADMTQVMGAWTECIANARAKLLSLPSKVAPELVQIADANVIATRIRVEVYAALTELAQWSPGARGPESVPAGDIEDLDAAAGPDGERMGGPIPAPVQRKRRRARPVED
jgi:hypothetical protein